MNIVNFPSPPKIDNSDAIEMMEQWLEHLRSGYVVSIAVSGLSENGDFMSAYSGSPADIIGPTSQLLYRMNVDIAAT